jgi:hypothetical protein
VYTNKGILLFFKKKELLPCEAIWLNLVDITLNGISQHRRINTAWFHLHGMSRREDSLKSTRCFLGLRRGRNEKILFTGVAF